MRFSGTFKAFTIFTWKEITLFAFVNTRIKIQAWKTKKICVSKMFKMTMHFFSTSSIVMIESLKAELFCFFTFNNYLLFMWVCWFFLLIFLSFFFLSFKHFDLSFYFFHSFFTFSFSPFRSFFLYFSRSLFLSQSNSFFQMF